MSLPSVHCGLSRPHFTLTTALTLISCQKLTRHNKVKLDPDKHTIEEHPRKGQLASNMQEEKSFMTPVVKDAEL